MAPIEDILAFDIRELKAKLAGANTLRDMAEKEADELRAKLAATEVQRDAALAACRDVKNYFWESNIDVPVLKEGDVQEMVEAALAMTPANAAGMVEENKRLREALGFFGNSLSWMEATDENGWPCKGWDGGEDISDPADFARQALEGPPCPAESQDGAGDRVTDTTGAA